MTRKLNNIYELKVMKNPQNEQKEMCENVQVKAYLEQGGYYSASKHLTQMFAKVGFILLFPTIVYFAKVKCKKVISHL